MPFWLKIAAINFVLPPALDAKHLTNIMYRVDGFMVDGDGLESPALLTVSIRLTEHHRLCNTQLQKEHTHTRALCKQIRVA